MTDIIVTLLVAVIGSNAFTAFLQHRLTQKAKDSEDEKRVRETLACVAYMALSNEVERLLSKDFATPEERRVLTRLYNTYKANGWNGDMDERMDKVYHLRTDHAPRHEQEEVER